ncbi:MAG: zinc ribbon domain-containing protein [Candidatus Hodarchaeales archaeon]|jgi:hypothetical protein
MNQVFNSILHESDDLGHMMEDHNMFWPFSLSGGWMWLIMMGYALVILLLTVWTYQDAKEKGERAVFWTLLVFFTMGIGVLFYLLVRRSEVVVDAKIHKITSMQGTTSQKRGMYCENCGNTLELVDQFCAKCGVAV